MKKLLSILLILSMLVCMIPAVSLSASAENVEIKPDTTWWDNRSESDRTFYLYDAADLLGFAKIMTDRSKTATRIPTVAGGDSTGSYEWKFILASDIDLNPGWDASTGEAPANIWPKYNGAFYFHGTFDGQGHTIKGIYQDNQNTKYSGGSLNMGYTGIFGGMYGRTANIQNLTILNSYSTTNQREGHGILFGCAHNGATVNINNVYIDAYVSNTTNASGDYGDGGFVGSLVNTSTTMNITNSVFAGDLSINTTGTGRYFLGGFLGRANCGNSKFENCAFYGNIRVTAPSAEAVIVGKFAAYQSSVGTTLTVKNCVAGGTMALGDGSVPDTVTNGSKNGIIFGELVGAARYNSGFCYVSFENNVYTGGTTLGCGYQQGTEIWTADPESGTAYYTGMFKTNTGNVQATDLNTAVNGWTGWTQCADGKPLPTAVATNLSVTNTIVAGYQAADAENGAFRFRIVGVLDLGDKALEDYAEVGFKATVTKGSASNDKEYATTKVYSSVDGNTETGLVTYTAEELGGDYIFVMPGQFPEPAEGETITVTVQSYYKLKGDDTAFYSETYTLNVAPPKDHVN